MSHQPRDGRGRSAVVSFVEGSWVGALFIVESSSLSTRRVVGSVTGVVIYLVRPWAIGIDKHEMTSLMACLSVRCALRAHPIVSGLGVIWGSVVRRAHRALKSRGQPRRHHKPLLPPAVSSGTRRLMQTVKEKPVVQCGVWACAARATSSQGGWEIIILVREKQGGPKMAPGWGCPGRRGDTCSRNKTAHLGRHSSCWKGAALISSRFSAFQPTRAFMFQVSW